MLPEGPSVSREDLEGRQYAKGSGIEVLMVGRWKRSVGSVQLGYGRSLDLTGRGRISLSLLILNG